MMEVLKIPPWLLWRKTIWGRNRRVGTEEALNSNPGYWTSIIEETREKGTD